MKATHRMTTPAQARPTIIGRSTSHFTRVTRIFSAELGIEYSLRVVPDILSSDVADYGGNPALKLPALQTERGVWFGALNVCRELSRLAGPRYRVAWPEAYEEPLLANTQELVLQAMATEVTLLMARYAGDDVSGEHHAKMRTSLLNTLVWLEDNARGALAALPADRHLSYLEVTLFCLVTHLEFRDVAPLTSYPRLTAFCGEFGERPSAQHAPYRADV